jgi:hypothetical protein
VALLRIPVCGTPLQQIATDLGRKLGAAAANEEPAVVPTNGNEIALWLRANPTASA